MKSPSPIDRRSSTQYDEEFIIRDFFDDRKGRFFVDVDSYHWQEFSTTRFLEKHLDWSGIAIDAQAGLAESYKKNRPKTKFFSYAVSDKSGVTLEVAHEPRVRPPCRARPGCDRRR